MRRIATLILFTSALAGCDVQDQAMQKQKKYGTYDAGTLWPDGAAARPLPNHVVAAATEPATRPPGSPELLTRGRERYEIFCAPCHGYDGSGHGIVVARGFPQPPSYQSERLRAAPAQHFFDVITNGYGVMYSYASRVPPADRWAIIAYIRALQVTQTANAGQTTLPPPHAGGSQ